MTRIFLIAGGITIPAIFLFPLVPPHIFSLTQRNADINFGTVQYKVKHGDIFAAQYGSIAPPDNPEDVLSEHTLAWDEDGFRISQSRNATYEVVALGDSYTEAANVAYPWANILPTLIGQDVRNLGYRGYSPQQETRILQDYALALHPHTIIVGFFGGNDLSDAGQYASENPDFTLPEIARETVQLWNADETWNTQRDSYQYPVYLSLQERTPVAFLNGYVAWMTLSTETLKQTLQMEATIAAWQTMQTLTPTDTCLILAYFPYKAEIYLPYVETDQQYLISDSLPQYTIDLDRHIASVEADITYQQLLDNRHNIRDAVLSEARAIGLTVIDLTPAFEDAAAQGEMLYYSYDTHWNQAGHTLAAQVIADELSQFPCNSIK